MSAIGKPCLFCNETLIVETEASQCLRCGSYLHHACAAAADHVCPSCHDQVDYPERAYFYSMGCPECLAPNSPPKERCAQCGAWTRWNNQPEYENFLLAHRQRCRDVIKSSVIKLIFVLVVGGFFVGFLLLTGALGLYLGVAIGALLVLKVISLISTIGDASRKLHFH
jgi:hypothetical protein